MNLYPAIDLYEGKVVRLKKGDFEQKTVYSDDPAAFAKKWAEAGAPWIHVVDLEGAKTGLLKNLESLKKIRKAVKCKVQFGGGLRSVETIDSILKEGIDRVVVGTKAMDGDFLAKALKHCGARLAVGLDVKDGKVQTQGWLQNDLGFEAALQKLNATAVETVIYTDIQRDGMMQGPNFDGLKNVLKTLKANVILSGGVSSLEDVKNCTMLTYKNFDGMIIGKALYENQIDLKEALSASAGRNQ